MPGSLNPVKGNSQAVRNLSSQRGGLDSAPFQGLTHGCCFFGSSNWRGLRFFCLWFGFLCFGFFFSLGVFLTGSDTSANALFGNLQVVTANQLGLDPAVMASANSAGGVMGKMISLQSLAVAVAATGMARSQEGDLFRFTIKHSIFLASVLGVLSMIYAYL